PPAPLFVPAGAQQTFSSSSQLDISACPITFYGKTYRQFYVNFTSESFVVCLGGFYSPGGPQDCLLVTPPDSQRASLEVKKRIPLMEMILHRNLPSIQSRMDCFAGFSLQHGGQSVSDAQGGGASCDMIEINKVCGPSGTAGSAGNDSSLLLTGVIYSPGSQVNSPETCLFLNCSEDLGLQVSACGPLERCQGNGSCIEAPPQTPMPRRTCTVVGPAVLDVHGQMRLVEDRCSYALLSAPDLQIVATFQERRRKDVGFLDGVILQLGRSDVHVSLDPGGRIRLNNLTMVLNGSAQRVYGVEVSKDRTGVTVQVSRSNLTASVFFNGDSVQLHLEGPAVPSLGGLCGNSSGILGQLRPPEFSSTGCETRYSDAVDASINCTLMAERCNVLKGAPFSSCDTDPEPFITACRDVLCKYGDLDGLRCQFLEVYARACSLSSGAALEGLRSRAECSPPMGLCQDRTCGPNEFCSETGPAGQPRCLCRALFASEYLERNTLGGSTVCRQNSASLSLVGCLLEDKGIDYTQLHLNDPACKGQMNEQTRMVTFSFNSSSCGTEVLTNSSHVIFKNTIRGQNVSSDVTRYTQFHMDSSCAQTQPDVQTVAFSVRGSTVVQLATSGSWNYTLTLEAFTDAGLSQAVQSSTELQLNQRIWVELRTHGLEETTVVMVMDSCWATDNGTSIYELIHNGCANPADRTVQVERNGQTASSVFSFKMFSFSESSGDVDLTCRLKLCFRREESCSPYSTSANISSFRTQREPSSPPFYSPMRPLRGAQGHASFRRRLISMTTTITKV
uniref:ZP domain-containing protein n=1 Tax=Oryzias latipes TaxID=8090 RepID=A0A3B3I868_ORYLA